MEKCPFTGHFLYPHRFPFTQTNVVIETTISLAFCHYRNRIVAVETFLMGTNDFVILD